MLNATVSEISCPVCSAALAPGEREYSIDELFELWKPVEFSQEVIEAHRKQAPSTRMFRCSDCQLEVFLPQIIGTPGFYVEAYNLTHSQAVSTFTYSDNKWEFGEAIADAAGCGRVFEFGCGNGDFLARMREHAAEVAGSEYNTSALARARARGIQVLGPSDSLTAFERSWDAVFSFHVLEHAADPVDFVARMVKMAKPGGLVGISVPDQGGPIRFIDPCVMNMPPHHATRWHLSSFEALARRLGLVIERIAYEPLLLENHSYYSVHWVRHAVPGRTWLAAAARLVASASLRLVLGGLRRLGWKYFTPLKGQSIYVLMTTPRGRQISGSMHSPIPLICPEHAVLLTAPREQFGPYRCPFGCAFPVVVGIPRFVPQSNYADSFGLQWTTFRRTQLDSYTGTIISRDRLARIAGGSLELFRGKDVLEAGCGAGRFTEIILSSGARLFAADISSAVEANYANCGDAENYFVCQADIVRLPIAPDQFDVVVCIGAIQHTPDPEQTMTALCSYLKPGGLLLIDHYPPNYPITPLRRLLRAFLLRHSSQYSLRFCTRMVNILWPIHQLLWKIFRASPFKHIPLLPKIRSLLLRISPVVDYHDAYPELGPQLLRTWALLDTHDTLTDVYKHLRSREQIEVHLLRCGMLQVETTLAGNGVEARARKPDRMPRGGG